MLATLAQVIGCVSCEGRHGKACQVGGSSGLSWANLRVATSLGAA